jgi:hypothetical protein
MKTRLDHAAAEFIQAVLDAVTRDGGRYERPQFSWRLDTTASALADLLVMIYPELDNLHDRGLNKVPSGA